VLTPPERRVAELAAAGKTNRDVAAALFISPKRRKPTWRGSTASSASTHARNSAASSAASNAERYYASAKLRVTAGSTGMPGPVVVETVTFFR